MALASSIGKISDCGSPFIDQVDGAEFVGAEDGEVGDAFDEAFGFKAVDGGAEGVLAHAELGDEALPARDHLAGEWVHAAAERSEDYLIEVRRANLRTATRAAGGAVWAARLWLYFDWRWHGKW